MLFYAMFIAKVHRYFAVQLLAFAAFCLKIIHYNNFQIQQRRDRIAESCFKNDAIYPILIIKHHVSYLDCIIDDKALPMPHPQSRNTFVTARHWNIWSLLVLMDLLYASYARERKDIHT